MALNPTVPAPLAVQDLESAKLFVFDASAGYAHSLVLVKPGYIYAMGSNNKGQLGLGNRQSSRIPLRVLAAGPTGEQRQFKQVVAGLYHSLALTSDGLVFSWGSNSNGQLGLCASAPRTSGQEGVCYVTAGAGSGFYDHLEPMQVMELSGVSICSIATGARHTLAISDDGNVYAWGDNKKRQLGVPLALDSAGPLLVLSSMSACSLLCVYLFSPLCLLVLSSMSACSLLYVCLFSPLCLRVLSSMSACSLLYVCLFSPLCLLAAAFQLVCTIIQLFV